MKMGFLEIVGIIAVLITAGVLFKEMGYDGWYFTDFFLSIILQVIMVGGLYLALRKFVPTGKVFFIAAAAASFAAPLLGYIVFHAPHNKEVKRENNIRKAIRSSAKYKEFSDYIDRHNDEIIAVGFGGMVYHTDKVKPLYVTEETKDSFRCVLNHELRYPDSYVSYGEKFIPWDKTGFFTVAHDERAWTMEEAGIIKDLIKEKLDQKDKWYSDNEKKMYIKSFEHMTRKKALKNPY